MPIQFLTSEQRQKYSVYFEEPSAEDLGRNFFLDDRDKSFISHRKGDKNRLGLALQLCTVRHIGFFLKDLNEIPEVVIKYVACQLYIEAPLKQVRRYKDARTRERHFALIKENYDYKNFIDQPSHFFFIRWLYNRGFYSAERPIVLFEKKFFVLPRPPPTAVNQLMIRQIQLTQGQILLKSTANFPER